MASAHARSSLPLVIIYGPTGVGKSDLATALAQELPSNIINMDVGQLYEPFGVGTAKPDWRNESAPHYLFDHLTKPIDYTVVDYRKELAALIEKGVSDDRISLAVGGSGFYAYSLLFEHQTTLSLKVPTELEQRTTLDLWEELKSFDPLRAAALHQNDRYRIVRALSLWHATGEKPSEKTPLFRPVAPFFLLGVMRDRQDLYDRINKRTELMLSGGWIDEVQRLVDTPWEDFLRRKNLIGYPEVFDYVRGSLAYKDLVQRIQEQTRQYAKRQCSFWRMLERKANEGIAATGDAKSSVETVNLTSVPFDRYINQLSHELTNRRKE